MKVLFGDFHNMTELKTFVGPAPGPTRRGLTTPLIVQPLLSREAPWKQVSFAKILIIGVNPRPGKCFFSSPPLLIPS